MTVTVTIPTATSMKLKFPEFAELDDSVLEFAIEEARLGVGTNWIKGQDIALLYLAAHYVAAGQAASAGDGGDGIASESIGRFSITYKNSATSNASATSDDVASSTYGRRYAQLRDLNFGGPVIV